MSVDGQLGEGEEDSMKYMMCVGGDTVGGHNDNCSFILEIHDILQDHSATDVGPIKGPEGIIGEPDVRHVGVVVYTYDYPIFLQQKSKLTHCVFLKVHLTATIAWAPRCGYYWAQVVVNTNLFNKDHVYCRLTI